MNISKKTLQQIERAIRKIAQKFPVEEEVSLLTDIHLLVSQETGELRAFDDDDNEITRVVIDEWIDNKDDDFFDAVTRALRDVLKNLQDVVDNLGLLKPYSFVLQNDDKEDLAELYVADDDTIIIGGDLMKGLDKDLNDFFKDLMK
ncbi:MAG: hypothetical protein K5854_09065 [Prevotella sp.]|jgi:hypothetical protein|nr:hypothetical protein [Prevotella sp.]